MAKHCKFSVKLRHLRHARLNPITPGNLVCETHIIQECKPHIPKMVKFSSWLVPLHWPVYDISFSESLLQYMYDKAMKLDISLLSSTRRGSRDVNKDADDLLFSLTYLRKTMTVIPKMFLFFWNAYISKIAYVSTPWRVETLKININKSAFKSVHNLRRSSDLRKSLLTK